MTHPSLSNFPKEEHMNKGDLIKEVEKVTSTKKEAAAAVDAVFKAVVHPAARKKGDTN